MRSSQARPPPPPPPPAAADAAAAAANEAAPAAGSAAAACSSPVEASKCLPALPAPSAAAAGSAAAGAADTAAAGSGLPAGASSAFSSEALEALTSLNTDERAETFALLRAFSLDSFLSGGPPGHGRLSPDGPPVNPWLSEDETMMKSRQQQRGHQTEGGRGQPLVDARKGWPPSSRGPPEGPEGAPPGPSQPRAAGHTDEGPPKGGGGLEAQSDNSDYEEGEISEDEAGRAGPSATDHQPAEGAPKDQLEGGGPFCEGQEGEKRGPLHNRSGSCTHADSFGAFLMSCAVEEGAPVRGAPVRGPPSRKGVCDQEGAPPQGPPCQEGGAPSHGDPGDREGGAPPGAHGQDGCPPKGGPPDPSFLDALIASRPLSSEAVLSNLYSIRKSEEARPQQQQQKKKKSRTAEAEARHRMRWTQILARREQKGKGRKLSGKGTSFDGI
ncbi:hypothetical protein Efla_007422 [Eimeria flavescens]